MGDNQRRRQLSYVNALRGGTLEDRPLPPPSEAKQDNEGWEKATRKKFRRLSGEPRQEVAGKPTLQCRSPPTIRTPTGTIEVCGQCLHPGHKADECRREITCWRCGGVGHKGVVCKEAVDRQIPKKKVGEGRRATLAPVTGEASKSNTEVTTLHGRDAADTRIEKSKPDKAASAAQQGGEESAINGQLPEDMDDFDFEETIRTLTATWQPSLIQNKSSGSIRIPDKLDPLNQSSLIVQQLEAPMQIMENDGPLQNYNSRSDNGSGGPTESEAQSELLGDTVMTAQQALALTALVDQINHDGRKEPPSTP
ncbi:hypothetical protein J5N97_003691 [Dioscorea zingiberensis]|uniref:CCHC-type domain-containing protein n=1 Tax=Dioscorea zingiberensis TaxID=325984 RepID=A0A9D5HQB1_9LILI|nr:hypothetical protein J5N97_003691 [Dioscorea zingiberensis]